MILSAAEAVAAALDQLPPDFRAVVQEHFLDGISMVKIQRQRRVKRREVEAAISMALDEMREYMRRRGIRASFDVL